MNKYLLIAFTLLIVSSRRIHRQGNDLDHCAEDNCHDLAVACFGETYQTDPEPTTDCGRHFLKCLSGLDLSV